MQNEQEHLGPELSAYLDGELQNEEQKKVEAHLKTCEACRELARELQETTDILRSTYYSAAESSVDLTGVWEEIASKIEPRPSLWQRIQHLFERPVVWLPAAGAVVATIILVLLIYPGQKPPVGTSQVESLYSSSGQVMVLKTARSGQPLIWILAGAGKEAGS